VDIRWVYSVHVLVADVEPDVLAGTEVTACTADTKGVSEGSIADFNLGGFVDGEIWGKGVGEVFEVGRLRVGITGCDVIGKGA
jgi:hypothetical protein